MFIQSNILTTESKNKPYTRDEAAAKLGDIITRQREDEEQRRRDEEERKRLEEEEAARLAAEQEEQARIETEQQNAQAQANNQATETEQTSYKELAWDAFGGAVNALNSLEPHIPEYFDGVKGGIKELAKSTTDSENAYNYLNEVAKNAPAGYTRNDKFAHAYQSCVPSQNGAMSEWGIKQVGNLKEFIDVTTGGNTQQESDADNLANYYGRLLARLNPDQDCEDLVKRYYPMYKPKY